MELVQDDTPPENLELEKGLIMELHSLSNVNLNSTIVEVIEKITPITNNTVRWKVVKLSDDHRDSPAISIKSTNLRHPPTPDDEVTPGCKRNFR